MLNPNPPASVVAGNVETSTCITNTLYGALGVMAAGQCTMNNFTFGNARHQYYETISGGGRGRAVRREGRCGGFDGTSVVQTHMTNSRLTDPEVLEFRFPVRLESYEIRQGSGGAGRWHGGNGGVRRVRFLEPMTASILSNGRKVPSFGMAGGPAGQVGINRVVRGDGRVEQLGTSARRRWQPGDVFEIHTPGGGGFGGRLAPSPSGGRLGWGRSRRSRRRRAPTPALPREGREQDKRKAPRKRRLFLERRFAQLLLRGRRCLRAGRRLRGRSGELAFLHTTAVLLLRGRPCSFFFSPSCFVFFLASAWPRPFLPSSPACRPSSRPSWSPCGALEGFAVHGRFLLGPSFLSPRPRWRRCRWFRPRP
jgi:hypothetical protein